MVAGKLEFIAYLRPVYKKTYLKDFPLFFDDIDYYHVFTDREFRPEILKAIRA